MINVSILARPFERALPAIAIFELSTSLFQSSPALSSGRYELSRLGSSSPNLFQSSPALSSGRYRRVIDSCNLGISFQSSPALSSGRYLCTQERGKGR